MDGLCHLAQRIGLLEDVKPEKWETLSSKASRPKEPKEEPKEAGDVVGASVIVVVALKPSTKVTRLCGNTIFCCGMLLGGLLWLLRGQEGQALIGLLMFAASSSIAWLVKVALDLLKFNGLARLTRRCRKGAIFCWSIFLVPLILLANIIIPGLGWIMNLVIAASAALTVLAALLKLLGLAGLLQLFAMLAALRLVGTEGSGDGLVVCCVLAHGFSTVLVGQHLNYCHPSAFLSSSNHSCACPARFFAVVYGTEAYYACAADDSEDLRDQTLRDLFTSSVRESMHVYILLAVPYATLFGAFLPSQWYGGCCSPPTDTADTEEIGLHPTRAIYETYAGLNGRYYALKVAALQASTVMLQAFGKMKLFGAAVLLGIKEGDAGRARAGFWAFIALLVFNSIYPAVLLLWPEQPWARRSAAILDALLDMGYLLCSLTVSVGSVALAFPSDFLGYMANYTSVAHCLCVCRALGHHAAPRLQGQTQIFKFGKARGVFMIPALYTAALLFVVVAMILSNVYPVHTPDAAGLVCYPCVCSQPDELGGRELKSCRVAVALRIESINLSSLNISSVDEEALQGLQWLRRVDLSHNRLRSLPENRFRGLSSLETVDLRSNPLASLSAKTFDDLPSLQRLDLPDDWPCHPCLCSGPNELGFWRLESCRWQTSYSSYVYLTDQGIDSLAPQALRGLSPQLKRLDLNNNHVTALPAGIFDDFSNLESLGLERNSLTSLPVGIFDNLSSLQVLYLQDNNFSSLSPGLLDKLINLESLHLERNSLTSLPVGIFDNLSSLESLNLQHNSLTSLPIGIFDNLSSLQQLYLKDNNFSSLSPSLFDRLTSLRRLSLPTQLSCGDCLCSGPDDRGLRRLESCRHLVRFWWIDLQNQHIGSLAPQALRGLSNLENFYLQGNHLTALPIGIFNDLSSLQKLYLRDNNFSSLSPSLFDRLTSLQRLSLPTQLSCGDCLCSGPDDRGLRRLESCSLPHLVRSLASVWSPSIDLRNQHIGSLVPGALRGLSNLETLYLQRNSLTSLPVGIFDNLSSLQDLRLEDNNFSSLSPSLFDRLTSLQRLSLPTQLSCGDCLCSGPDDRGLRRLESCSLPHLVRSLASVWFPSIDLRNQYIGSLAPGALRGLSNLWNLHLEDNNLTALPTGIFRGLSRLRGLRLQRNSLSLLPRGIFDGLTKLTELNLEDNNFSSLSPSLFDRLTSLRRLSLPTQLSCGDCLCSGPDDRGLRRLESCRHLVRFWWIDLQNQHIGSLAPQALRGLSNLENFYLQGNHLTALPIGIFNDLSSLQKLYLRDNNFSSLSPSLFDRLTSLQRLSLPTQLSCGDCLCSGPDDRGLRTLESCSLPHLVGFLRSARSPSIDLRNQYISSLAPGALRGLSNLETLYLQRNSLTSLPLGIFDNLSSLQVLYLQDNNFSSLSPGLLDKLINLESLHLERNSLTSLPIGIFDHLSRLRALHLFGNGLPPGVFSNLTALCSPCACTGPDKVGLWRCVGIKKSKDEGRWGIILSPTSFSENQPQTLPKLPSPATLSCATEKGCNPASCLLGSMAWIWRA